MTLPHVPGVLGSGVTDEFFVHGFHFSREEAGANKWAKIKSQPK
jgi:hypothetical protein